MAEKMAAPEVIKTDARRLADLGYRPPREDVEAYRETMEKEAAETEPDTGQKPVTAIEASVPDKKIKKTAAYCRVSTLLISQETSIRAQREHYETLIRANPEWEYAGIYLEAGVSGTKAETRPQLQKLIQDCKDGRIDLVLTKSISRFSRNTTDCLEMVRTLTSLGVEIFFEKEEIHTGTMESELMLSLLACFAENESRSISGNMKWGIRKRFQNGTYRQSQMPYGYESADGEPVIVPAQADVVRRIFNMTLSGNGMETIAGQLNADRIPAPQGGRWSPGSLRQIVCNPAYKGDALFQKTFVDENFNHRINRGELDQYYCEGHHDPIVSAEEFDKAQEVMAQRAKEAGYLKGREKNRAGSRCCFSGILKCADCGKILHRNARKNQPDIWICAGHKNSWCPMLPQPEQDLKNAFISCLNKLAWSQNRRQGTERALDFYERLSLLEDAEEDTGGRMQELAELKKFVRGWEITGDPADFPEEVFRTFVESVTVDSQKKAVFHFRCGLNLQESLERI